MAEIPVHKKSSMAWMWILLALVALALVIWWATDNDEDAVDLASDTQIEETIAPVADPDADAAIVQGATLAAILADPAAHFGTEYTGEVSVGDSLTDRGFWVEHDGERMFALIVDEPRERPLDINAGQRLKISGGEIRDTSSLSDIEGRALDANTRKIAGEQKVIMVVDENNIEVLTPA